MSKIIKSAFVILAVASIAGYGTYSFFSDTETSTGNTLMAGSMDLKVDHTFASYNGDDCKEECVPGSTNLLATIGFETPEVTNSAKWDIFPSPVGGWTVEWFDGATTFGSDTRPEIANLEYHEDVLGSAYQGDQYVELDTDWYGPSSGTSGEPASVKIYQDITTVPDKKYQVKFAFAPRPDTPASDNALDVVWEGATVFSIPPTAGTGGPIAWTLYSFDVSASDASSRLEFIDKGTPNSLGTFIDDLQLYEYTCDSQIIGDTCTLWDLKNLEAGDKFWDFGDIKPGDYGLNIISLHAYDNDAYACLRADSIIDVENMAIDPEIDDGDDIASIIGELSQFIKIFAWEDSNEDNNYDSGESILVPVNSPLNSATSTINLIASNTKNIGLAWCVGEQSLSGDDILCDGENVGNIAQTDIVTADIKAYAEQQRNNGDFVCPSSTPQNPPEDDEEDELEVEICGDNQDNDGDEQIDEDCDLFFSEYIEGSSNNKALEIYNPTSSAVNLNAYKVERYANGGLSPTSITLSGSLAGGDVYVLCHSSSNSSIQAVCDNPTPGINYNGDDAVVLKNSSNEILDVIGQIGFDPGSEWGTGLASTQDNTLVRKCEITQGDSNGADVFNPTNEWDGFAVDTFTNLGSHICP